MTGTMKEWDTRPIVLEKLSADLEPFSSVSFCSQHPRPPAVLKEGRNRCSSGSFTPMRPPTKRKRVEEDVGPLDMLIPLVLDPFRTLLYILTMIHQAPLHSLSSQVIASRTDPCPT